MKIKFLITTVVLCFVSMATRAENTSDFSVKIVDKNSIVLQLAHVQQPQIQVTLKDADGVTLHDEALTQTSLKQQKYSLRELPSGDYTLIVVYDAMMKVQLIQKEDDTLEIEATGLTTIYFPVFRQHSGFLDLNMLCLSDLKLSIGIHDDKGHLIYDELIQPDGALQRRFNLSELEQGSYVFTLRIVDSVLNKEFKEYIEWLPTSVPL